MSFLQTPRDRAILLILTLRAFTVVGSATSAVLDLVIAFFGLSYLLRSGGQSWLSARRYVPFSPRTADAPRDSFFSVTEATLLGTVLISVMQGALVARVTAGARWRAVRSRSTSAAHSHRLPNDVHGYPAQLLVDAAAAA